MQEAYGDRVEFPDDDGKFDIGNYSKGRNFTVSGSATPASNVGEWQTRNAQSTPALVSSTPTSSRVARRIPLATIKIVRADLNSNLTAHINLYIEEQACLKNIQLKVREEMADNKLVIVGANGLLILDQKAARGNPKYFC